MVCVTEAIAKGGIEGLPSLEWFHHLRMVWSHQDPLNIYFHSQFSYTGSIAQGINYTVRLTVIMNAGWFWFLSFLVLFFFSPQRREILQTTKAVYELFSTRQLLRNCLIQINCPIQKNYLTVSSNQLHWSRCSLNTSHLDSWGSAEYYLHTFSQAGYEFYGCMSASLRS